MAQSNEVRFATLRVFILEDSPVFLGALVRLLGTLSWIQVVGTASDGRAGLARAESLRPEVVLFGLDPPGRSGYELLSLLRTRLPETQLIALSLFGEESERSAAMAAGAHFFVSKQVLLDELIPRLRRFAGWQGDAPLAKGSSLLA